MDAGEPFLLEGGFIELLVWDHRGRQKGQSSLVDGQCVVGALNDFAESSIMESAAKYLVDDPAHYYAEGSAQGAHGVENAEESDRLGAPTVFFSETYRIFPIGMPLGRSILVSLIRFVYQMNEFSSQYPNISDHS